MEIPEANLWYFAVDTFICLLLNHKFYFLIQISLKFITEIEVICLDDELATNRRQAITGTDGDKGLIRHTVSADHNDLMNTHWK